jgi:hypothetical protein
MEVFGEFWRIPPIFLVTFTTFYYFLLPNLKKFAVTKHFAVNCSKLL